MSRAYSVQIGLRSAISFFLTGADIAMGNVGTLLIAFRAVYMKMSLERREFRAVRG